MKRGAWTRDPSGGDTARSLPSGPVAPVQRGRALPAASAAKGRQNRARAKLVARLAALGVRCEVCPELLALGIPVRCTGLSGLHERRKRSSAGATDVARNLIPTCSAVNGGFIEDHPAAARALGDWLVIRQGDPEWDSFVKRVDPVDVVVELCQRCGAAYVTVPPSGRLACGHRHQPEGVRRGRSA